MFFKSMIVGIALALVTVSPQAAMAQRHSAIKAEQEHKKDKKKNTLLGMGLGLLGGAIMSGGDPWATIGGAAAGGVIGNVATKDKRNDRDWRDRRNDDRRRFDDRRR
ncbi:MAG TPA: hypothetical protein VF503_12050 [Sphingobium sp.]|uniref:hypothetical protein n=1 Tax=Sphingobium sp. TaxID=1912891 RepID=UPI002ED481E5